MTMSITLNDHKQGSKRSPVRLFVVALRRSGSTIFWDILRQDPGFRAFNEPFNPLIRRVSDEDWIGPARKHYAEYESALTQEPQMFWERFSAIYEIEELQAGLTDRQRRYLQYLLELGDQTLLETTRCHFKLADLAACGGEGAVLVHLHRQPESFATSHLLPSTTDARRLVVSRRKRSAMVARAAIRRILLRRTFWSRRKRYDSWGVENVIGEGVRSAFFARLTEFGLDPMTIAQMPAVGRLLAYWRVGFQKVEHDGPQLFGGRFISVALEDWCRDPAPVTRRIYRALGREVPDFDFSSIREPSGPFDPSNPKWLHYRSALEIDETISGRR